MGRLGFRDPPVDRRQPSRFRLFTVVCGRGGAGFAHGEQDQGQEYAAVPPPSHHIESQVAITHHRAGAWTQVSHPPQTRTSMIAF